MKKSISIILLSVMFSFSSVGQIRIILEDGSSHDYLFGPGRTIADWIFEYRLIYDKYPSSKNELIDFQRDIPALISEDEDINYMMAARDSIFLNRMQDDNCVLATSGDTCSFTCGNVIIRCTGGAAELIKYDSSVFYGWAKNHPLCYDRSGRYIAYPYADSLSTEAQRHFRFYVTMKSTGFFESGMNTVLIPVTMNREGGLHYDLSHLSNLHLFYQENNGISTSCVLGEIPIESAIDLDYFALIKATMWAFLCGHPEVERMRLWEPVMFNKSPMVGEEF